MDVEDVEMPHEPWGQSSSASAGGSSSADDAELLDLLLVEVWSIIDKILGNKQSQELNRRLCSILLNQWHVNIIYINYALEISFGSNNFLSSFFLQLGLNTFLNRV